MEKDERRLRDALQEVKQPTLEERVVDKPRRSGIPSAVVGIGAVFLCGALAIAGYVGSRIDDIFGTTEPATSVVETIYPTDLIPTNDQVVATLPTYTPKQRDEPIDFDIGVPSVSISILDNLNEVPGAVAPIQNAPGGKLSVEVFAGGNPLKDVEFGVFYAVVDIAGKWALDGYVAYEPPASIQLQLDCTTDINGFCETILEPGTYALIDRDEGANWQQIKGIWGIYEPSDFGGGTFFLPFRIDLGKTTEIDINLASLEVGLLSSEGAAMSGEQFYIQCQGEDIAGKKIGVNTCKRYYEITGARGTANFYLGAGTYMIVHTERYVDEFFPDIILEPGEQLTKIVTIH